MEDKCKICRQAGEKLFLKGEKCFSPKCAFVKKPYAPGLRGKKAGRRRTLSDFGVQLKEKQKFKSLYQLREKKLARYVKEAVEKRGLDTGLALAAALELRLDNVVFRLGFAPSRNAARQLVSHGHIVVNGRKVNIPSYQLRVGDRVSLRPESFDKKVFENLNIILKKHNPPSWLKLDAVQKSGEVAGRPTLEMFSQININPIIEFFSR